MNMLKRFIVLISVVCSVLFSCSIGTFAEKENDSSNNSEQITEQKTKNKKQKKSGTDETEVDDELILHTDYYLLADLNSEDVLLEGKADEKVYPASTTKILTGIIALESLDLSKVVTATKEAIEPITKEHSSMGILVGEQLTVEQLLYGMLVHSSNDAANVLAVEVSGGLEAFCEKMNQKAEELGCENSNFVNAHGFHDDNHYTTIRDLYKITLYAMKNKKFREIVATEKYQIPATNKYKSIRYLTNTNMFISNNKTNYHIYHDVIGIKTGHTDESGSCIVAAAVKNSTTLLSIVMKCKNEGNKEKAYSFVDSRALFDYGFEKFKSFTIASKEDIVLNEKVREAKKGEKVTLSPKVDFKKLLPIDTDASKVSVEAKPYDTITAPILKGDILGEATYSLNGEVLGTVELIAANSVKRDWFLHIIYLVIGFIKNPIVIIALIALLLALCYAKQQRNNRRRQIRRRMREIEEDMNGD